NPLPVRPDRHDSSRRSGIDLLEPAPRVSFRTPPAWQWLSSYRAGDGAGALAFHSRTEPMTAERMDAANTASFAAEKSFATGNACAAMNSDIVNPMPANAPAPHSWRQE